MSTTVPSVQLPSYGLGDKDIGFHEGEETFLFFTKFIPSLGPVPSPNRYVTGTLFPELKLPNLEVCSSLPSIEEVKHRRAIPSFSILFHGVILNVAKGQLKF
jgi:hypothetical protein